MKLQVINSGSSGNAYILGDDNTALLIECGVSFPRIKKALAFRLPILKASVCTHEHMDHAQSVRKVIDLGVPVVMSQGTATALKLKQGEFSSISHGERITIDAFSISAFNVDHDVNEPLGFIFEHDLCGRVLFVTDTYILRYDLGSFDHIIIEANYSRALIPELNWSSESFINQRRFKAHMSFETTITTLERMDLSNCKNIVLIHLSDGYSNEINFKKEVEARFGIPTTVATSGQVVIFSKSIF